MIDDYAPVVVGLEQDVDEVEEIVFSGSVHRDRTDLPPARGGNRLLWAVRPLLGPLESLQRGIYPQINERLVPFFRDLNDHLKLVNEEVGGQRASSSPRCCRPTWPSSLCSRAGSASARTMR